MGNHQRILRS